MHIVKAREDQMLILVQRIINSFICDDHKAKTLMLDEYRKKTVES
jgi:hypothetical protein